ncbi:MAG TPA: outer membrane beta-barrel protein [Longimicrobiales bacterium]|nr:outer membrane beta-barrel protein [Longimicrobiales bacterium]
MAKRLIVLALSLAVALPAAPARAQSAEIGFLSGLSVFTAEGRDALTTFSAPGNGFVLPTGGLYATLFPTPNLAVEPQVGFLVLASGGATEWLGSFGGQVAYHTRGGAESSPYFGGNASWVRDVDEDNNFTLGGVVGYRFLAPPGLGVRVEAGYRRWFTQGDDGFDPVDFNQFAVSVGIGGLVGG